MGWIAAVICLIGLVLQGAFLLHAAAEIDDLSRRLRDYELKEPAKDEEPTRSIDLGMVTIPVHEVTDCAGNVVGFLCLN